MEHPPEVTDEFVQKAVATGKQYCAYLYQAGPNRDQPPDEMERSRLHIFVTCSNSGWEASSSSTVP